MKIGIISFLFWCLVVGQVVAQEDPLPFDLPGYPSEWKEEDFENRFKGSYGINSYLEPEMDVDNFNVYEGVLAFLDNKDGAIAYLKSGMVTLEEQELEVSATLNFLLANFYFEKGDHPLAIEQYIAAVHKHPDFLRAYENLGYSFMQNEENEKALPVLLKALELGSNDSQIHGLIGFLYLEKDLYLSALSAYEMAMLFNPRNNTWRFGILQCLIFLGRNEDALGVAEEILLFDPDRAANWQNVASLLLRVDRESDAAAHLEVLHQLGGATYTSRRLLGNLYYTSENIESASREFLEMIKLVDEPGHLQDVLTTVEGLMVYGYIEEAQAMIVQLKNLSDQLSVSLDPVALDFVEALLYLEQGQTGWAETNLNRVLAANPGHPRALLAMGNLYLRTNDWDQALIYLELAELYPEVAYDAYYSHAQMLLALNQPDEALEKLQQAYALNSNDRLREIIRSLEESGRLVP